MESFVFEVQVLFRLDICSVTESLCVQCPGGARGQNLVSYENCKSIGAVSVLSSHGTFSSLHNDLVWYILDYVTSPVY